MHSSELEPKLLIQAYANGYFPMPEPGTDEVLWFRPDPRAIIPLDGFHVSKSLRRSLAKRGFSVTFSTVFREVMQGCADRDDTWINNQFLDLYTEMNRLGLAHSVEIWQEGKLVGGTYGVCFCGAFFAESKFHKVTDASKAALFYLVERLNKNGFKLLECQFLTPHLQTLGAIGISDTEYQDRLKSALEVEAHFLTE